MKKLVIAFVIAIALIFAPWMFPKAKGQGYSGGIISYGNGVLYFAQTEDNFGRGLSAFIASHPELEVTAMASDDTMMQGKTKGYFIITRPKQK